MTILGSEMAIIGAKVIVNHLRPVPLRVAWIGQPGTPTVGKP